MEELRKKLMEELKNKLGEGYEVSPVDVNKNNGTILHGISIMLKGNIGGPTVYVDNFYQRFQGTNEEIEEMIDYILEDIRSCYEIDDEELQRNVYEYDRAKEHLRVALCNYEAKEAKDFRVEIEDVILKNCHAMFVCGREVTGGMQVQITKAKVLNIPIYRVVEGKKGVIITMYVEQEKKYV